MSQFLSPEAARLAPYTPGEQPRDQQYIKLNTNESPFPPSPAVAAAVAGADAQALQLYSDPTCAALHRAIARYYGVEERNVLAGNGSDEILAFAFRAFCGTGRPAVYADVTYGFYQAQTALFGLESVRVPLREDYTLAVEDYMSAQGTVFLANPNAPTGLALPPSEIRRLLEADRERVVVVDEAYVDFGGESCVPLTKKYSNLLVVQTYSKSRSMAGARLGYAIGDASLIQDLETIKFSTNPFNVNQLTMKAGAVALAEQSYYDENCKKIMETRDYTTRELEKLGFSVLPSKTNFIFAKKPGLAGAALYQGLKERGVLVRYFDKDRIRDYNRITNGTREQMDILLEKVRELLQV